MDTCMWSDRGEEESSPAAAPAETKARNGDEQQRENGRPGGEGAVHSLVERARRTSTAERVRRGAETARGARHGDGDDEEKQPGGVGVDLQRWGNCCSKCYLYIKGPLAPVCITNRY